MLLVICASVQYVQSNWCAIRAASYTLYTVAEYEWIFSSLLWIFSCVSWTVYVRAIVWVIHGDTCRLPVYQHIFSCLLWIFSCYLLLVICVSLQYIQLMCYMLLVIQLLRMFIRAVVWVIPGVSCRYSLCIIGFFHLCCGFFPVIHSWACVHQCRFPVYRRSFSCLLWISSRHLCISPIYSE